MVERQHQTVNAALGIVGPTGAGKSCLIATAAEYLWDLHRKVLHLATADGGGFPTKIQTLVNRGVIRVWRMRTRGEAFETTVRASQGWWPSQINPKTGETPPNVKLVPPITERYVMHCPNGHVVKTVPFQSLLSPALCSVCKIHTTKENMLVERSAERTKGFEQVGGQAFDGLTSFLTWQLQDMGQRHARMELKGEESALGGRIVSGDLQLGGNNRSHYGFVQGQAEAMVLNSTGIPYLDIPPIWTALLMETVDEGGLPVKGMKLAGKAKTDEAGAWFGNTLEVGVVVDTETGANVRRLWLSEFTDDNGVRHLIKHRGGPSMPPYLQDPTGAPWSQVNLGVFFDLLEKDVADQNTAAEGKYQGAPGVSEAMTFGDGETAPAPATTATAPTGTATPARPTAVTPPPRVTPPKPRTVAKPKPAPPTMPAATQTTPASPPASEEPTPAAVAPPSVEATSAETRSPEEGTTGDGSSEAAPTPAQTAPPAPTPVAPRQTMPAPGPRPAIAPPPGPRPPAVAPRRPAPRPATPPPVPVGSK